MGVRVGIDLGTTYSAVAYVNPETKKPEIIPNKYGNRITQIGRASCRERVYVLV